MEGRGARARTRTKAGLGFEATIAPNTTSSLADVGRNLDWAREGGGHILKASMLVLIGVSILRLALRRLLSVVVGVSISLSTIKHPKTTLVLLTYS